MVEHEKTRKAIRFAIYALLALTPVALTLVTATATEIKTTFFNVTMLVVLVLTALRLHEEGGLEYRKLPVYAPVLAYLLWTMLSASLSSYHYATVPQMLRVLSYIGLFFLVANYFGERKYQRWILLISILASVPPCIYGVFQHFRIDPIAWLPSSHERILATFGNPTYFAAYLAFTVPVTFAAYMLEESRPLRFTYLTVLALQQICLLWTYSRGPWLGTAFALGLGIGLHLTFHWRTSARKYGPRLAIVVIILLAATVSVAWRSAITQRAASVVNVKDPANAQRVLQWQAGNRVFLSHPVFGVGPGALRVYMAPNLTPAFFKTGIESVSEHAHNEFIEIAAETGIVGIGVFLWILFHASVMTFRFVRRSGGEDGWGSLHAGMLLGGIAALLICNLVGVTMRYSVGSMYFWLYLGLLASICEGGVKREASWFSIAIPEVSSVKFGRVLALIACVGIWFAIRPFIASIREKTANAYISEGQIEQGEREINRCLALSPHNTSVLYRLASLQNATGRTREALETYRRLARLSPDYGRIHLNLGVVYMNLSDPKCAAKELERAAKIDGMPDTWQALSEAYRAAGDAKKSRWAYQQSLLSDPSQGWRKELRLAEMMVQTEDAAKAEPLLNNVLKENPDLVKPRLALAQVYDKEQKTEKAEEQYKLILAKQPNNAKALTNLGCIYYRQGKLKEAKRLFEKASRKGGGLAVDANLSLVYWKMGDPKHAMQLCEYVLKTDPDCDAADRARALIYRMTGEKRL